MATFSLKQQNLILEIRSIGCISSLCLQYFCDKVDNDNDEDGDMIMTMAVKRMTMMMMTMLVMMIMVINQEGG